MNIGKMKAAGVLGILAGIMLAYVGYAGFSNPASHAFWNILYLVVGILSVVINISIAMDAAKKRR